jgi:hypothetical protein
MVQFISVKGTVTDVFPYNEKSVRFAATTDSDLGDIAGFRATSIEEESGPLKAGEKHTFSIQADLLTGEATNDGEPGNYLWSTSRGSADDLSTDQVNAIKALLGNG